VEGLKREAQNVQGGGASADRRGGWGKGRRLGGTSYIPDAKLCAPMQSTDYLRGVGERSGTRV